MLQRLIAITLLWVASPATAAVTVTFYSHEFGSSFPHAFVALEGTLDSDGTPVKENWGFTAVHLSPAILWGSVKGKIESVTEDYRRNSDPQFSVTISDDQYRRLYQVVESWRTIPGKSYNLNRRNCIHFVGALARAIGLNADDNPDLMKKPRSYLLYVKQMNPAMESGASRLAAAK